MDVGSAFEELNGAVNRIDRIRREIDSAMTGVSEVRLRQLADSVRVELTAIESLVVQTRPGGWANDPRIREHLA